MKKYDKKPNLREHPMTYEDYAALPGDERYELAGGVLELLSPAPSSRHQLILVEILDVLRRDCRSDYVLVVAPIDLILSPTEVRQPDLVLVHRERRSIITERGIEGAPDLVAEVLSPHSVKRDRESKLRVYAEHGVPEYWIVDYENEALEQYVLSDGKYVLAHLYERDEVVQSERITCVGFTMRSIVEAVEDALG